MGAPSLIRHQEGAVAPLFDRLLSKNGGLESPEFLDVLSKEALQASILHELTLLLNTRCVLSTADYMALNPLTLKHPLPELYGLPDFSEMDPASRMTWRHTEELITNAIRLFEPRLTSIKVKIQTYEASRQDLEVSITAHMIHGRHVIPIDFPLRIQDISINKSGKTS